MEFKIAQIDPNLHVEEQIDPAERTLLNFYNVRENEAFSVHGIFYDGDRYLRMPRDAAASVNEGVALLNEHTAGGRVRFRTDSTRVAILLKVHALTKSPGLSITGAISADLYERTEGQERYLFTYVPPFAVEEGYEGVFHLTTQGEHELTVNLPSYSGLYEIYIGLDRGASLTPPTPYRIAKPVVFYGSSITQGADSSRPGLTYEQMLCRRFDFDYLNLGFSGKAKGEDAMAEYIASLDMTAFVYDYDYNAPTVEHLAATHKRFFDIVRASHPDLPILCLSRPMYVYDDEVIARRDVIARTYRAARDAGDKNVYFLEGKQLFALCGDNGTVDYAHPHDFGFFSMAEAIGAVFEKIL